MSTMEQLESDDRTSHSDVILKMFLSGVAAGADAGFISMTSLIEVETAMKLEKVKYSID